MKDANSLRGCKNKELKYHLVRTGTVGRLVCLIEQGHMRLVNVISVTWKLIFVYYAFFHAEFK